MAVVLQEKVREFAEDNDKQNPDPAGGKRHEMQEKRNEMPGIGNERPCREVKRQNVSARYRYNPHGYCIQDVNVTFKIVTTLEICTYAQRVQKLLSRRAVLPLR
ncbi:hypothetical protein CIW65_11080 [Enterobacter cloacae]|nr:hypothetical protein CIW65_11080 [Enterobacter cloacae]